VELFTHNGARTKSHSFFRTDSYFEADCDVTSSKIARGIMVAVQTWVTNCVIDLAFMIEPQRPEDCPERILGVIRFHSLDLVNCGKLPPPPAAVPVPMLRGASVGDLPSAKGAGKGAGKPSVERSESVRVGVGA